LQLNRHFQPSQQPFQALAPICKTFVTPQAGTAAAKQLLQQPPIGPLATPLALAFGPQLRCGAKTSAA
jgi:hypothetical protein